MGHLYLCLDGPDEAILQQIFGSIFCGQEHFRYITIHRTRKAGLCSFGHTGRSPSTAAVLACSRPQRMARPFGVPRKPARCEAGCQGRPKASCRSGRMPRHRGGVHLCLQLLVVGCAMHMYVEVVNRSVIPLVYNIRKRRSRIGIGLPFTYYDDDIYFIWTYTHGYFTKSGTEFMDSLKDEAHPPSKSTRGESTRTTSINLVSSGQTWTGQSFRIVCVRIVRECYCYCRCLRISDAAARAHGAAALSEHLGAATKGCAPGRLALCDREDWPPGGWGDFVQ